MSRKRHFANAEQRQFSERFEPAFDICLVTDLIWILSQTNEENACYNETKHQSSQIPKGVIRWQWVSHRCLTECEEIYIELRLFVKATLRGSWTASKPEHVICFHLIRNSRNNRQISGGVHESIKIQLIRFALYAWQAEVFFIEGKLLSAFFLTATSGEQPNPIYKIFDPNCRFGWLKCC